MNALILLFSLLQIVLAHVRSLDVVAQTPPMGWNSWNHFRCPGLNEGVVKTTTNLFISTGLSKVGYSYINLDDCWQISRNSSGYIVADPSKFPSGIPSLVDYVHSHGLKFGLYTDRGLKTCQGRPGSYGYEEKDAEIYAKWGADYVKNDDCNIPSGGDADKDYGKMYNALKSTGRAIVHSVKGSEPIAKADTVSNMRRVGHDIGDNFASMVSLIDIGSKLTSYAHPGFWNDLDMLEIGNGGLSTVEEVSHFSMWCIMKAPLILGNDLSKMSNSTLTVLLNEEAIEVNQDSEGKQGKLVETQDTDLQVWSGALSKNRCAVVLFNRSTKEAQITANWEKIGLATGTSASVRDLWAHKDVGTFTGSYAAKVAAHGVVMVTVSPSSGSCNP